MENLIGKKVEITKRDGDGSVTIRGYIVIGVDGVVYTLRHISSGAIMALNMSSPDNMEILEVD